MSTAIGKKQCPRCAENGNDNSRDNLVEYDDSHSHCFACGYQEQPKGPRKPTKKQEVNLGWSKIAGVITALPDRGISSDTCDKYKYRVADVNGRSCHVCDFYRDGLLVAQKIRYPDKSFRWYGESSNPTLYGQHLWKQGGRRVVVTEGELDCLAANQVLGGTWPVVSIPNGAAGAARSIKENLEFLSGYQEIILMFDSDEAGREAALACASLLPPGQAKIAELPLKDANEMLVKGKTKQLVSAMWEAQTYRPDGILHAKEIKASSQIDPKNVWEFPWDGLTAWLIGQRSGEVTMWTSGTGSGKSTIIRELVNHHLISGRKVGMLMLEESPEETLDDIISVRINKQVRKIRAMRVLNRLRSRLGKEGIELVEDDLTDEEYEEARRQLGEEQLFIYDSYGMHAYRNLVSRMRYMAVSLECDVIILDHITAAVVGMMAQSKDEGSAERLFIDEMMKELRQLVDQTGVHVDVVSQLRKTQGAQYEEGGRIGVQDLRGSGSLASVPNTIIAMERNRQHTDPLVANTSILRVLKDRFGGHHGMATALRYDHATGRLLEVEWSVDDDGDVSYGAATGFTSIEVDKDLEIKE